VQGFPGGSPVTLEIAVGGRPVATLVRPNERGWAFFRVDTASWNGRRADLRFAVSTPNAGGRHYCFTAEIER